MRWSIVALLLFAFCAAAERPAVADTFFPYKVHTEILPNGLKVLLIPMDSPGLVAYYSVVRTGSRDEVEPGKTGFAHFFEHIMFRGTLKYPGGVYDSIVTSLGADANAFTDDDITAFHLNFAAEDLEKVIDIESDRFQHLHYELPDFQTEAGAIYGEYRKNVTDPFEVLSEKVRDLAFDVHTYKHTTMGFERDIKAMPEGFEYSRSFFRRFYRPENVVLLVVGDIAIDKTMDLIRKYYGGWEKGYAPSNVPPEPPQKGERTAEVVYQGKTLPIIDIAYKGEAFHPASRTFAAALLMGDLAFGVTSDLYKKLYIQDQRVDALEASIPSLRDMPLFEIYARVKREEDVGAVKDDVYATIAGFQKTPVDAKRLADAKKRRRYGFLMGLDTPDRVASRLAYVIAVTGGVDAIDTLYGELDKVTPDDIMTAAKSFFTPENRTVVVLKGTAK